MLAICRALGDFEQELYIKVRESKRHKFLVLAFDKVWDLMSNEDIQSFLSHNADTKEPCLGGVTERTRVVK